MGEEGGGGAGWGLFGPFGGKEGPAVMTEGRGVFDGFGRFCSHLAFDAIREISLRAFQRCKNH